MDGAEGATAGRAFGRRLHSFGRRGRPRAQARGLSPRCRRESRIRSEARTQAAIYRTLDCHLMNRNAGIIRIGDSRSPHPNNSTNHFGERRVARPNPRDNSGPKTSETGSGYQMQRAGRKEITMVLIASNGPSMISAIAPYAATRSAETQRPQLVPEGLKHLPWGLAVAGVQGQSSGMPSELTGSSPVRMVPQTCRGAWLPR